MTMAYILAVNPGILSEAINKKTPGDLFPQIALATAVGSAFGTFLMGVVANYPFALAPGMGMNAFFAFSVVIGLGLPWELALGCVFIEGLIFLLLTLVDVRRKIITAIPDGIKLATGAGIGMFIAYIGLSGPTETGAQLCSVSNPHVHTQLLFFSYPRVLC
jgi:adenine/guanine/hypoxanthine permease